jgi:hypothetical protein
MVWVTNTGDEFFVAHWDSKAYSFLPGKHVELPKGVAQFIFGYGVEDKVPTLARLGWTKFATDVPAALERLDKFVISETQPTTYHNASPVVDRVPFPASRQGRGKDFK